MRNLFIIPLYFSILLLPASGEALDLGRGFRNVGRALDAIAGGAIPVPVTSQPDNTQTYTAPPTDPAASQAGAGTTEEPYWLEGDAETEADLADGEDSDDSADDDLADDDGEADDASEKAAASVGGKKTKSVQAAASSGGDKKKKVKAADADSDTIEVIATGIGKDNDSALKNALRTAVEQAVGTLIDTETMAENDEVVSDQILTYSAGFVQSHQVIGKPKIQEGLVTIKINAVVKRTELVEKLEAADIHVTEVDGESLFGEAVTKLEQNKASGDIVKKAFEGFPTNVLEIKRVDKPSYDERNKKWVIKTEISVNREKYRAFVKKLLPVLEKVASGHKRITLSAYPQQEEHLNIKDLGNIQRGDLRFFICTQINDARTNTIWETYTVPEEAIQGARSGWRGRPTYSIDIIDARKDVITSGTYNAPRCYSVSSQNGIGPIIIMPILGGEVDGYGYGYWRPGTEKVILSHAFDVSPDEFKRMKNVICRIEK